MTSKKMPENAEKIYCEVCDFVCCKQSNFNKHLTTGKHKRLTNASKMLTEKLPNEYDCVCGKSYKHRGSLFKHKKTCTFIEEKEEWNPI